MVASNSCSFASHGGIKHITAGPSVLGCQPRWHGQLLGDLNTDLLTEFSPCRCCHCPCCCRGGGAAASGVGADVGFWSLWLLWL